MITGTDVFQYDGKRFAVTYDEVKVLYDPGFRIRESGKKRYFRNVGKTKRVRRIDVWRKMVVCILRTAFTGEPYTGVAILHPDELKTSNPDIAKKLAFKRAVDAYSATNCCFPEYMRRNYRLAMLKRDHPDQWSAIQEMQEKRKAAAEAKEKAKRAHQKALKHQKKVKPFVAGAYTVS